MGESLLAMHNEPRIAPASHTAAVTTLHRNCPACDTNNRLQPALPELRVDWAIKRCGSCEFVYLENAPHYADLAETFAWEKTYTIENAERRRQEPLLMALGDVRKSLTAKILRFRKGGKVIRLIDQHVERGRLLDVGCGHGNVLRQLPQRFTPYGIDISAELAASTGRYAAGRGGSVLHQPCSKGWRCSRRTISTAS